MTERVFLGWDGPFLPRAADWLLDRRDELPRMLVLAPTAQGGRRLRETMAEQAGALLAPKIMTPGALLRTSHPEVADDWVERVAWLETLEEIADWQAHSALFPSPPESGTDWAPGLAGELTRLRRALQENGLTLAAAARILKNTIEAARWESLAGLERAMEQKLRSWGLRSRSRALAADLPQPADVASVVLAGVAGMPPLVEKALESWGLPVTVLIAAPEECAHLFSPLGRPTDEWSERALPWPECDWGSVSLVADHRQEAAEALRLVAERQTPSDEVALGSADPVTGDELARVFTRAGWPAFHPAAGSSSGSLARWLKTWRTWLADPRLSLCADLLALPATAALVGGSRAAKAWRLAELRDSWMVMRPGDLRNRTETGRFRSEKQRESAQEILRAVETLERHRNAMLGGDFVDSMRKLLDALSPAIGGDDQEAAAIADWLMDAEPVVKSLRRDAVFWLGLMIGEIPCPPPQPPDGRVIDVQGWLELLLEPGRHLVLCGMNEGLVPARQSGDAWLGENARRMLGLPTDAATAARDAFLYQAMLEARRDGGRVDILCAKTGPGGEALQPSRLLLATERDDLPKRVSWLFQGVEPPEAGLRWHADWKWQPRAADAPQRLPVTSLASWLACPFRFYLRYAVGMNTPEPGRIEWNARDYGTIMHEVLERWGNDKAARDLADESELRDWFHNTLDRVAGEWFAERMPLAVRLQVESMRQRFAWLAEIQAEIRSGGWETIEVETKCEIPVGDRVIVGKIDRIDRHTGSGALRVIDYKTGGVTSVDGEHRKKLSARTALPEHVPQDSPVVFQAMARGKPADFRWTNLQLPLYAAAVRDRLGAVPVPCYLTLGSTKADVTLREWGDFSGRDLDSAMECARWIAGRIADGVFWPPAAKPRYDDFAILAAGRSLEEMCLAPGS